jgi:transposase
MARRGRPTEDVVLTDDERETLERWARRPKSAQALALRCRIVLECATGRTNVEVAQRLGATVSKWRRRFIERRLEGLHDEPRPGAPRTVSDEDVERVVVKTLEETPHDATHWSTRLMARDTSMSQSTVSRIWQAFGLKPHLTESFKLSPDPQFIEKVRDIVGLVSEPARGCPRALCRREVPDPGPGPDLADPSPSPRAPRARHPRLPPARHDEPLRGTRRRLGPGHRRPHRAPSRPRVPQVPEPHQPLRARGARRARGRGQLIDPQDARDPPVAPAPPAFHAALHPDLQLVAQHVERWFAELTNKWPRRGTHRSTKELEAAILDWTESWNENPCPFVWHKSADEILDTLAGYCARISGSGH